MSIQTLETDWCYFVSNENQLCGYTKENDFKVDDATEKVTKMFAAAAQSELYLWLIKVDFLKP